MEEVNRQRFLEAEILFSIVRFQEETGRNVTEIRLEPYFFAPDFENGKREIGNIVKIECD